MSFDSIPTERLTNIIGEQRLLRWEKQSTRSNISVKNKKTKFYHPLGVYNLRENGENKSPPDLKELPKNEAFVPINASYLYFKYFIYI